MWAGVLASFSQFLLFGRVTDTNQKLSNSTQEGIVATRVVLGTQCTQKSRGAKNSEYSISVIVPFFKREHNWCPLSQGCQITHFKLGSDLVCEP